MATQGDGETSDTRTSDAGPAAPYLYVTVYDLLEAKISGGELPPGTVLKEARLSQQLGTSRAPVRRALALLAERGLIRTARGQGYVVGNGHEAGVPLSSRELQEILQREGDGLDRSASWERIIAQVVDEVSACMPFGTYRIQESGLGDYHAVSRTVAREVLWRLMDRRLIEKDRKSHWIVGQMTARDLHETIELRLLLEPAALAHVAPDLDREWLASLLGRVEEVIGAFPACSAADIDAIDMAMSHTIFDGLRNSRLLGSIRRNQLSILVSRLFRQHFPLRDDLPGLRDHAAILRLLLVGQTGAASDRLRQHLRRTEGLILARLRVLSQLPPPHRVPYMTPVH